MVCFNYGSESTTVNITQHTQVIVTSDKWTPISSESIPVLTDGHDVKNTTLSTMTDSDGSNAQISPRLRPHRLPLPKNPTVVVPENDPPFVNPCESIAFPPPPPPDPKRIGPRREFLCFYFQ